jgi:hypothetical protein
MANPKSTLNLGLTSGQTAVLQKLLDSGTDGIVTLRTAQGGKITLGHVAMNAALTHISMNSPLSHVAMNSPLSHIAMNAPLKK